MIAMRKLLFVVAMGMLFFAVTSCSTEEVEQVSEQCDRQCLEGFVNQYLAGMVAHDASGVSFSENVRFTENAKEYSFAGDTESLWATSTGRSQ